MSKTPWYTKPLVDPAKTQASLLGLQEELLNNPHLSPGERMIFFKINSCLFSEYPHHFQKKG